MALYGTLRLMRRTGNGLTLVPDVSLLTEYTFTRTRMGMPRLTAKLWADRPLDDEWTGNEGVMVDGEWYGVDGTPGGTKDTSDARYCHNLELVSEREKLGRVYFFDTVARPDGLDLKPVSESTKVSFYGTLREFVGRLNCALWRAGIGDSAIVVCDAEDFVRGTFEPAGDGYCAVVDEDGLYGLDEVKELSMEDRYISEAMKDAFDLWGVPFSYRGRTIVWGEREHVVSRLIEYGRDREATKVEKLNRGNTVINEMTGYGSPDNIPYYYPNDTEYGTVVLKDNPHHTNRALHAGNVSIRSYGRLVAKVREGVPLICHYTAGREPVIEVNRYWVTAEYGSGDFRDLVPSGVVPGQTSVEFPASEYPQVGISVKVTLRVRVYQNGEIRLTLTGETSWSGVDVPWDLAKIGAVRNARWKRDDGETGLCSIDRNKGLTFNAESTASSNQYVVECEFIAPTSGGWIRITEMSVEGSAEDSVFWTSGSGSWYNLNTIGLSVPGGVTADMDGDQLIWEGTDRMPFQDRLVVPKYRDTLGAERMYRALNDVPTDDPYYRAYEGREFDNEYREGSPSQGIFENEDIKPTIDGIRNSYGELFGEIAAVAFDDNDNDSLKAGDEDRDNAVYEHPYFYIRLHRLHYVKDGTDWSLDLFGMASQTDAMTICMTSGRTAGCKYKVQCEIKSEDGFEVWRNPVQCSAEGALASGDSAQKVRTGSLQEWQQRSDENAIWIAVQKDTETFGVVMPNRTNSYLPEAGDRFNIVNIDLPKCYILDAERRLEAAMMDDLEDRNKEKWDIGTELSRIYLEENPDVAAEIDENSLVRVKYGDSTFLRYVESVEVQVRGTDALPNIRVTLSEKPGGGESDTWQSRSARTEKLAEKLAASIKERDGKVTRPSKGAVDMAEVESYLQKKGYVTRDWTAALTGGVHGAQDAGTVGGVVVVGGTDITYREHTEWIYGHDYCCRRKVTDEEAEDYGITYTDRVWCDGCLWQCAVDGTLDRPRWNSTSWVMLQGNSNFHVEFEGFSPNDRFDFLDFSLTLVVKAWLGDRDVTDDILDTDVQWTRHLVDSEGNEAPNSDTAWALSKTEAGKVLTLTGEDIGSATMPRSLSYTATVTLLDGVVATATLNMI